MSDEAIRLLAGDCTIRFDGGANPVREERGTVVVMAKPDGTVLVHDREGYRPVAWLTRSDAVSWDPGGEAPALSAVEGDRRLEVRCHAEAGRASYPATSAGEPVGTCPNCGGILVQVPGAVTCLGCEDRHGIPRDATLLESTCEACGLPRLAVDRGETFEVCIDRGCESLDDAVRARYDRAWSCPDCDGDLRIIRRGGLLAGCDNYPDCDRAFAVPVGTLDGDCPACGLPRFDTPGGRHCLDAACEG